MARTIRCAIAGSATRKARATSPVVSPPSARSVSATRASGASAGWQRGEDQPQPVVWNRAHELGRFVLVAAAERPQLGLERDTARGPAPLGPDPVQRTIARGGDDPGRRVVGQPVRGPALERGQERVLHRLLGAVEVAEDACEDGDRLARLAPEQAVDDDVLGTRARQDAAASEPLLAAPSSAA